MAFADVPNLAAPAGGEQSDIAEAIEMLPDPYRLVITLFDLEGYSSQETASILARSLTSTKSLHYRARRALRDKLDQLRIDRQGI